MSVKRWPYYNDLINLIKKQYSNNYKIVIAPGPNEIKIAEKIDATCVLNKDKALNIPQLSSLIKDSYFIKSLKKKRIPFREFKITALNEEVLGELFSYFILETVIVGKLANINPFDQPAVEEVKIKTKKILS